MLIKANDPNKQILEVLALYKAVFGDITLKERLVDIAEETDELVNYKNEENLKEELGDLICSCFALAAEKGYNIDELVKENLNKVKQRFNRGEYSK